MRFRTLRAGTMPAERSPANFLKRHEDGTTAIEFGIIAIPFFMFIFGLMAVSSYFFIMTSIEKGMDQSSRLIRTGQTNTMQMKVKDFKKSICDRAGGWVKCNQLQVFVQKFDEWSDIAPQPCITNNKASVNTANENDDLSAYAGEATDIVLVTACYKWKFAMRLPYIDLGQMNDGSMMIQASTTFRSEPYNTNN